MHDGRVFYTHIMKTGGTSLHRALTAHFGRDQTYPRDTTVAAKTFSHLLLDMDAGERAGYHYFCVHQPAWVAFEAAPDALKLTVLRDPVARTVSHLRQLSRSPHAADGLEALYDDDTWRRRLANHQTQFFSDTRARHEATPDGPDRGPDREADRDREADMDDPSVKRRFEDALVRFWGTAVKTPRDVDNGDLTTAIATLERFDIVGITEELDRVADRLRATADISLPALGRANATEEREPIPAALLERITADNQHDLALYAHARGLAGA